MVSQRAARPASSPLDELQAENALLTQQLVQRTAELETQTQQTARVRADLDAFTYSVSHDLKEPLRTLEAFSQFLIADYSATLDEEGQDFLRRIAAGSKRMKSLIDDLLTLSRAGRTPVTPVRIDMHRLMRALVDSMRPTLAGRQGAIEIVGALPAAAGEEKRLQQAFDHLLCNGIKFNRSARPVVTVRAAPVSAEMVEFYISDNGIGIEQEYHERVFGMFQRVHPREDYAGNGAGLAIAKRAVESLGGSIRIDATSTDGTAFVVTLPRAEEGS